MRWVMHAKIHKATVTQADINYVGSIGMNGAAAHLIRPGEEIIIMGFQLSAKPIMPTAILVDKNNRLAQTFILPTDEAGYNFDTLNPFNIQD